MDAKELSDAARDAGNKAKALAKTWADEQVEELKDRGPYFQAKLAVVVGYVLIALLTIAIVIPTTADFQVQHERLSFGLAFKTVISVKNVDAGEVDAFAVEVVGQSVEFDGRQVTGRWKSKPVSFKEGTSTKLLAEQFFNEKGQSPSQSFVPQKIALWSGEDLVETLDAPTAVSR